MKVLPMLSFVLLFANSLLAQDYSRSLITTTGEAIIYAAPDEIRMTLGIETTGVEISKTKAENNKISTETIKYLKTQGIASQHIQTQYLRVSKIHRGGVMVDGVLHKFSANQTIYICIKDLKKYGVIVDGLLEIGVTSVSGPQFRNTNIRKYKDEARVEAIKAAKEKAKLLADALGQSVGPAHQIKEVNLGRNRNNQGAYATGGDNTSVEPEGELSFAPGQLEVQARVEVSFLLSKE